MKGLQCSYQGHVVHLLSYFDSSVHIVVSVHPTTLRVILIQYNLGS